MSMDFSLWPMLLPLVIPIVYCVKYKRRSLTQVLAITLAMLLIVGLWPVYSSGTLGYSTGAYVATKILLFIVLPIIVLLILKRDKSPVDLRQYGVKKEGLRKSLWLCLLFLPVMLAADYIVWVSTNPVSHSDFSYGTIMFLEAFNEEFLFRGILFIFLLGLTNTKVAYVTSFLCFVLMHQQYYMHGLDIGLFIVFVQALLTIEIARRSGNIAGSWILHGLNRFSTIAIFPLM